jgi:predicted dehydrogenase
MADSPTVDWLLIGTGDIAQKRVAPALALSRGSRLVAVVGSDAARAKALAERHGATEVYAHAQLDQALAHTRADAVYVATPVFRHSVEAIAALAARKHVLVEKPLGRTASEARELSEWGVRARADWQRVSGCSYYRRLFSRYIHARQMLERGEFGQVVLVRAVNHSWYKPDAADPKHWRVEPDKSGGGPLADVGCHMIDQIVGLLGLPKTVYAKVNRLVQPYPAEDSTTILMTFAGGTHATLSTMWNTSAWGHELEIVGSNATLRWRPADTGKVTKIIGRETEELDLPNAANVHQPLVEDFVAAIEVGRRPVVPLDEALKTNLVMDAVYESARSGREVKLS